MISLFLTQIYMLILCTSFSGTGPPGRNGHERDSQVPCEVPSLHNPTTRKGWSHHRGLRPLLFSNSVVCSFTSHKNRSALPPELSRGQVKFFLIVSGFLQELRRIQLGLVSYEDQYFVLATAFKVTCSQGTQSISSWRMVSFKNAIFLFSSKRWSVSRRKSLFENGQSMVLSANVPGKRVLLVRVAGIIEG